MKLMTITAVASLLGVWLGGCDSNPKGVALYKDGLDKDAVIAIYPQTKELARYNCEFHVDLLEAWHEENGGRSLTTGLPPTYFCE